MLKMEAATLHSIMFDGYPFWDNRLILLTHVKLTVDVFKI